LHQMIHAISSSWPSCSSLLLVDYHISFLI
jgi:hypothetical protein